MTAGSYVSAEYAQAQAVRLRDKGYRPFVTEIAKEGITYHRVNVGTFEQRADAEKLQDQLRDEGVSLRAWRIVELGQDESRSCHYLVTVGG